MSLFLSAVFVAGLLLIFRKIERWMHQHVFKVGWLVTHKYETTTILYYTFFLPGVILHEVIIWLVAGVLNVRAEQSLKWPEKQEIGELRLNFVQLERRISAFKRSIIAISPLIAGTILIWLIANNVLNLDEAFVIMASGTIEDVGLGIQTLLSVPDFWLWIYLIFAISNTMFPTIPKSLQGWRTALLAFTAILLMLFIVGVGDQLINAVSPTLNTFLSTLQATLMLMIIVNLIMVLGLGTVEAIIERVTGHSATFRKGKMITMTRQEAIEERQKAREREQRQAEREQQRKALNAIYQSIYSIVLPVPGVPGHEPVTQPQQLVLGLNEDQNEGDSLPALRSADRIPDSVSKPEDELPPKPDERKQAIINHPSLRRSNPPSEETFSSSDKPDTTDEELIREEHSTPPLLGEDFPSVESSLIEPLDDEMEDVSNRTADDTPADDENMSAIEIDSSTYTINSESTAETDEVDEENEPSESIARRVNRSSVFNISPFSSASAESDLNFDEDDHLEDDETISTTDQTRDAVQALFDSTFDDQETEDETESSIGNFKLGPVIHRPTAPMRRSTMNTPLSRQPDEEEDELDSDDNITGELEYEDFDDDIYYEDDDEYADFDTD